MFVHQVKTYPVRHRRVGVFFAPDPWAGHAGPEEWNIETYKMMPKGTKIVRSASPLTSGLDRLAIKSERDGVPLMLPEAISYLWVNREVRAEALPELLRTFGPGMSKPNDFVPTLRRAWVARALGIATGVAVVAVLALIFFALLAPAPPRTPVPTLVTKTPAQVLAEPMVADALVTSQGPVQALAVVELPPAYRPPGNPDLTGVTDGRGFALARVAARGEQRLVLVSDYEHSLLPQVFLSGFILPAADLRLPADALARIAAGAQGLRTDLVICNHVFPQTKPSRSFLEMGREAAWITAFVLGIAAIPLLVVTLIMVGRLSRRRRQLRELRRRLGLPQNPPPAAFTAPAVAPR